ncbi:hypothetical protein BASA61_008044 [Batrachochytrium salamandrivorans]|nr:hypothetical protein BASA61_008044 [Batrachochytrium salamandrivorans]
MGEYVPIPKFDDPGFALLQVIGLSVALGQLVMVLRLLRRLHECPNAGKSLLLLLCGVNLCSCLLQTSKSASMITYRLLTNIRWQTSSTALQALLISLSSFIQAYLITTWLSKHLGFDTTSPNTRARYIAVVALLILTFVIDLGGIAAYVTSVYLYLQGTQPTFFLSRRVGQFAIICIGIEVITESVTLLNMLHLVCEKQLKSSVATESPDNIDSSEDFPTSIAIPGPPPGSLITTSSPLEMDHLGSQVNSMAFNLIRDNE